MVFFDIDFSIFLGYKSFFTPGVTFSNDINESVSEPSSTSSQECMGAFFALRTV